MAIQTDLFQEPAVPYGEKEIAEAKAGKPSKKELLEMLIAAEAEEPTTRIKVPTDVVPAVMHTAMEEQEGFSVVLLDGAHEIIKTLEVTRGLVNRTQVHPREVFREAIRHNAVAVIVAHNHPSGKVEPSHEDREVTRKLKNAGDIIGIRVLDHVIVAQDRGYYSFLEQGEI